MEIFTPSTIQLFVSLFFLTAIIVHVSKYISVIVKDKHESGKSKDLKVHIMYLCLLSAIIIVSLVTYICIGNYNRDNIIDYISFASTLSSLILSVVAIIFTIVLSNTGMEQNEKMNEAIHTLQSSILDFQTKTDQLETIAERLEKIEQNVEETKKSVSKITANNKTDGNVASIAINSAPANSQNVVVAESNPVAQS